MSRKFMLLMLVVFGGLLYAASFALNKQTEAPPAPTPEQSAEHDASMRKHAEETYAQRRLAVDQNIRKQALRKMHNLTKEQREELLHSKDMPSLPPGNPMVNAADRSHKDMIITDDWTSLHSDGSAGIEQEIKYRDAHSKPASAPQPGHAAAPAIPANGAK